MDGAGGWGSRKDCSLRKASCEHLCAGFSKRGASERHDKLVRKIPDDVSIPTKEVKGRPRTGSAGRSGHGALPGSLRRKGNRAPALSSVCAAMDFVEKA